MGKNQPQTEKRTIPANDSQQLGDQRKIPRGAHKHGGKSPK